MGEVCRRREEVVEWWRCIVDIFLRASSFGRNFRGVWYTLGALDGGLKTSVGSAREGVYEGASGRARSFLCRRSVDSWRR
jgi:hypothetical protein